MSESFMKQNQDEYSFVNYDGFGIYCVVHDDPKDRYRYKKLDDMGVKWYKMRHWFPFLFVPEVGIANIWYLPSLAKKKFKLRNKGKRVFSFSVELYDLNTKVRAIVTIERIKRGR